MHLRSIGALVLRVVLAALLVNAGRVMDAVGAGFTARVVSVTRPASVMFWEDLAKVTAPRPTDGYWWVVDVEFMVSGNDAIVPLSKTRLIAAEGGFFSPPQALMVAGGDVFERLDDLAKRPGVGVLMPLGGDDALIYEKKDGGRIVVKAKRPATVRLLFSLRIDSVPQTLELDASTNLPIRWPSP